MNESLAVIEHPNLAVARVAEPLGVEEILAQVNLIQSVMHRVMKDGDHYGTIPGCGDKKTLLQPGAQKLTMTFRLAPEYAIQETDLGRGHKEYRVICTLKSIQSGTFVGQGVGCCSSMESKYRWRGGARKCPKCGKETIIKGKAEYGGGWLCYGKKGGCGAKWGDGAAEIESQNIDKVENENPADTFNTVLKMAKKRAFVDATITATAASDIFTQDVGDDEAEEPAPPEKGQAPAQSVPKACERPMPTLKPTSTATTPLAPAPKPLWKSTTERQKWMEGFLAKCRTDLGLRFHDDPHGAVEFFQKSGLILPTEGSLSEASLTQLFPHVPFAPDDGEPDAEWKARVISAVKADAERLMNGFKAFQQGDQLEGAEVGHEAEPEQQDFAPVPNGALVLKVDVVAVSKKEGQNARGKWVRYGVKDENDNWYGTFSHRVGAAAEALKGSKATIFFTEGEKGFDLHKIIPA